MNKRIALGLRIWMTVAILMAILAAGGRQEQAAALYQSGHQKVLRQEWTQAEADFERLIREHPRSAWVDDARFWLCYSLSEQEPGSQDAFACFEEFTRSYPESNYLSEARSRMAALGSELVAQGHSEYAERVERLQGDQDEEVALLAIRALAESDDDPSALIGLFERSQRMSIRTQIVRELEDFDDRRSLDFLVELAQGDAAEALRRQAIRTLGERGGEEAVAALKKLAETATDHDLADRAIAALGEASEGDVLEYLMTAALSSDERRAMAALRAAENADPDQLVAFLRRVFQEAASERVRLRALMLIGEASEEESAAALEFLAEVVQKASDLKPRRIALRALAELATPEAIARLEQVARSGAGSELRLQALHLLGETDAEGALRVLTEVLQSASDASLRRASARALGETGDDKAVAALKQAALKDADSSVRRAAVRALGEIGSPAARKALMEVIG